MILAAVTLTSLAKIALFILVLSVLVVLHEYGHFILARLSKVRVVEFSVGFGPKLAGWTSPRSGTAYSFRALPLGGYCAMYGEDNKTSEAEQQREFRQEAPAYEDDNFQSKNPWTRLAIIAAGPIANFILCLAILFVSAIAFGVQGDQYQPRIGPLSSNMPAQRAGMHAGDKILQIDGRPIRNGNQLVSIIHKSLNKPLRVTFDHNGDVRTVAVTRAPAARASWIAAVPTPPAPP